MKPLSPRLIGAAGLADGDYVLEVVGGKVLGLTPAAAGGGGGGITVQDEGGSLATGVTQIDFQGAGVTAGAGTGEVVVTVPGATGGTSGGGGIDDPATWSPDLGYDVEFSGSGSALPAGWAWVNQETATYEQRFGAGVLSDVASNADRFRIIDRPLPTEPAWQLTGKLLMEPQSKNYWGAALTIRDAATSKVIGWGPSYNAGWMIDLQEWATPSGGGIGHPLLQGDAVAHFYPYWRITKKSATAWDFEVSMNGVIWAKPVADRNISTFLANPSHIGFGVWRYGIAPEAGIDWFRVR